MTLKPFCGKRVTVMGLGHFGGGVAAARWLAANGALVTATDLAGETTLVEALDLLNDVPIEALHLGGHIEDDFRHADLVVVNPAVVPDNAFLQLARKSQVPLTTEIGLFLDTCPGSVVGVTGTNGKSTTASMIAHLLRYDGRRTWLGGNLGGSLLEHAAQIEPDDWVVLELSSFQLHHLPPATKMARIAVVTNCTPNHLDWHEDYPSYILAKQRILKNPSPKSRIVLGSTLANDDSWTTCAGRRYVELIDAERLGPLPVPGKHNRENAVCAMTAALACDCDEAILQEGLASFASLSGRLERIATVEGRSFYNDTTATTPESTIAALGSLPGPIWLLAGGGDKGLDMDRLVDMMVESACGVAFYGRTGAALHEAVRRRSERFANTCHETMDEALRWCWGQSRPGDSILLSPACSSHDQFQNFRQRGEIFARLVASLGADRLAVLPKHEKQPSHPLH